MRTLSWLILGAVALSLGRPRAARAQAETIGFVASSLQSHTRVRRDSFDDVDWTGGDSYMKGIAKAQSHECTVDLYTRGSGTDYRFEIDFRDSLRLEQQHGPEVIMFESPPDHAAIRYWEIKWQGGTPKIVADTPQAMRSLVLSVSGRDDNDRLAEASRRAASQCSARPG